MRATLSLRNKGSKAFSPSQLQAKTYRAPIQRASALSSGTSTRSRLRWRIPAGLAVFVTVTYLSYQANRTDSRAQPEVSEDVSDRYHGTAKNFDKEVGLQERTMLMGFLRSWLVRKATGNVLEVGVGTGRNSRYYNLKNCTSLTMLDQAPEMLEVAKAKFKKDHPDYKKYRFVAQSAHEPITCPPGGFDTVVQTMSICSTVNPVKLLKHLGAITDPKEGRILLLEHGRSHYDWLNNLLDSGAAQHADKFGCWWNKDIGRIVQESGLEVVKIKRYHFGTTWWIELRPATAY